MAGKRGRGGGYKKTPGRLHTAGTVLHVKKCSCSILSCVFLYFVFCVLLLFEFATASVTTSGLVVTRCNVSGPKLSLLSALLNTDSGFSCGALAPLFSHLVFFYLFILFF